MYVRCWPRSQLSISFFSELKAENLRSVVASPAATSTKRSSSATKRLYLLIVAENIIVRHNAALALYFNSSACCSSSSASTQSIAGRLTPHLPIAKLSRTARRSHQMPFNSTKRPASRRPSSSTAAVTAIMGSDARLPAAVRASN